jgi:hypothetical protein
MTKTFFDDLADKREEAIVELDRTKFGPMIRNHLVQLFRKAHTVDPELGDIVVGMGTATIKGTFLCRGDDEGEPGEDGPRQLSAGDWAEDSCKDYWPVHQETLDLLRAVAAYSDRLCNGLGYINDITLDDLKTRSSEKAKVWKGRS